MKYRRFFLVLFLAVITASTLFLLNSCAKKEPQTVKIVIPAILPLTGPSSDLGQSVANGMRLAIEDMNEAYPRYKFELKIDDSKGQPKEAVTIFQSMLTKTSSPVILSWMSSAAKALSSMAASNKRVLFMGAAMPELTDGRDFVIRVFPNAITLAEKTASLAISKFNKAAILYINDDYGRTTKDVFKEKFESAGKNVVFIESLETGVADFRTILFKAKEKKPDVLYIPAYGPTYTNIIKQIREILPNTTIIADITLCNSFTLEQLGTLADGIYAPATIVDDEKTTNPDTVNFSKKYQDTFGMRADFNAGLGYDMARIAATAIINTDGSPEAVQSYIKNLKDYSGVTGHISFDKNGDIKIQIELMQIKNEKPSRLR